MKNRILSVAAVAAIASALMLTGCKKETEIVAEPKVTYTTDTKAIFVANCTPCHLAGSSVNANKWDDYTQAKAKIANILDRIQRAEGTAGAMPRNGKKLPDATIAKIKKWLDDGLLEK